MHEKHFGSTVPPQTTHEKHFGSTVRPRTTHEKHFGSTLPPRTMQKKSFSTFTRLQASSCPSCHAELVSASHREPPPVPIRGQILKQVQDDVQDDVENGIQHYTIYSCLSLVMLNLFQHLTASLRCSSPRTDPETSSG